MSCRTNYKHVVTEHFFVVIEHFVVLFVVTEHFNVINKRNGNTEEPRRRDEGKKAANIHIS